MNGLRDFPTGRHLGVLAIALIAGLATGAHAQGAAADVAIVKYQFTPQTVRIAAGGSVRWTNGDKRAHIVQFSDGSSPEIAAGGSYERRFERAGEYPYFCGIHNSMRGVVVVE